MRDDFRRAAQFLRYLLQELLFLVSTRRRFACLREERGTLEALERLLGRTQLRNLLLQARYLLGVAPASALFLHTLTSQGEALLQLSQLLLV